MAIIIRVALPSSFRAASYHGGFKSIINIAGVRRARRRSTSAPPVWRGFLFAVIARRAAVGRTNLFIGTYLSAAATLTRPDTAS